jgi:hypothetical protein
MSWVDDQTIPHQLPAVKDQLMAWEMCVLLRYHGLAVRFGQQNMSGRKWGQPSLTQERPGTLLPDILLSS